MSGRGCGESSVPAHPEDAPSGDESQVLAVAVTHAAAPAETSDGNGTADPATELSAESSTQVQTAQEAESSAIATESGENATETMVPAPAETGAASSEISTAAASSSSTTSVSTTSGTVAAASSSSSSATATVGSWRDLLAPGSQCDALDTEESWYTSTILMVSSDPESRWVCVRYNGWGAGWDEWLPRCSPRLAPPGTFAFERSSEKLPVVPPRALMLKGPPDGSPFTWQPEQVEAGIVAAAAAVSQLGAAAVSGVIGSDVVRAPPAWHGLLKPGDVLDARDGRGSWSAATVVDACTNYVRVRFPLPSAAAATGALDMFGAPLITSEHAEGVWILRISDRLAPRGQQVPFSTDADTNAVPDARPLPPVPVISPAESWRANLVPGSLIDWQANSGGTWYSGTVIDASVGMLWLKYTGWDHSWNMWLPRGSALVQPSGTKVTFTQDTVQPYVPGAIAAPAAAAAATNNAAAVAALLSSMPPPPDPAKPDAAQRASRQWIDWGSAFLARRQQNAIVLLGDDEVSESADAHSVEAASGAAASSSSRTREPEGPWAINFYKAALRAASAAASSSAPSSSAAGASGSSSSPAYGFAVRRSASVVGPTTPAVGSAAFLAHSQRTFVSRIAYARLVMLLERMVMASAAPARTGSAAAASAAVAAAQSAQERRQAVHRAFTGEVDFNPPSTEEEQRELQERYASSSMGSPASSCTGAAGASAASAKPAAAMPVSRASGPRPSLAFHDASGVTLLARCVQIYLAEPSASVPVGASSGSSAAAATSSRRGYLAYLPLIARALDDECIDVNHIDGTGRSLLLMIAQGPLVPQPGAFLYALMELLCSRGADPNYAAPPGSAASAQGNARTVYGALVQTAGPSLEQTLPCIRMLRRYGLCVPEGGASESPLLRVLSQPNARVPLRLLELCMLNAVGGGSALSADADEIDDNDLCVTGSDVWACTSSGLSVLDLLAGMALSRADDPEVQQAASMAREFVEHWREAVVPYLRAALEEHMAVPLAAIVTEYIDGSGRPFPVNVVDSSSSLSASSLESDQPFQRRYAVGDAVDVFDAAVCRAWYAGMIVDAGPAGAQQPVVRVHYTGWDPEWDVWVNVNSGHLAPIGTHAHEYSVSIGAPVGPAAAGLLEI